MCFAGETLALLAKGKLAPCEHEVSTSQGAPPRSSVVFQCLARPDAVLAESCMCTGGGGAGGGPLLAGDFAHRTSAARVSSNGFTS